MPNALKTLVRRLAWRRRSRRMQILLDFARTEAGTAVDINRAAEACERADLRQHLRNHANDEARHAELFRARAAQLLDGGMAPPCGKGSDLLSTRAETQRREGIALTDQDFLPSDGFRVLGELRYLAFLHVAEAQAAVDFEIHLKAVRKLDPGTAELLETILRDENFHVAYTRDQLERLSAAGQHVEVSRALRDARRKRRRLEFLKSMQVFGDFASTCMMTVVYFTLFVPFGVIGRLTRRRQGWVSPQRTRAASIANLERLA
jgi:rubrerythrin